MNLFNNCWRLKGYIKKHMMVFLIIIIPLIVIMTTGIIIKNNIKKQEIEKQEKLKLQTRYYIQNDVFELTNGKNDDDWVYIGVDKLDISKTVVGIYVYNNDMDTNLTLQEVVDYLSKEYAEDGTLMINIRPVAIDGYIDWYNNGGDSAIRYYIYDLKKYMKENGYECNYTELSLEELQKILPLVSE